FFIFFFLGAFFLLFVGGLGFAGFFCFFHATATAPGVLVGGFLGVGDGGWWVGFGGGAAKRHTRDKRPDNPPTEKRCADTTQKKKNARHNKKQK
ncbi:hypothetical protein ACQWHS_24460, partial [Salmonella enterica subsp. enterica serovar Infantis]